jgi:UDP-N-acetylmuramyl pentapeptide synthase
VGGLAGGSGITGLFATGEFAEEMAAGAAEAGLEKGKIFTGSKEQIAQRLFERIRPEDWILVKGSRAMAMEEIVRMISKWAETKRE